MTVSDQASYEAFLRRVRWIILALGVAGASVTAIAMNVRTGASFLIGAIISFSSFWGWERVVERLGPQSSKPRSRSYFVLRLLALVAVAWVIIKYLRLNVAAAAFGLLVSGAAVVLELIYELSVK
jgi:hypothetical protein